MAQPMPSLCELDLELDLEDVGPLTTYWMLVKFIVVYPGTDIETFEVSKCCREDGVVYLKKDHDSGDRVAQFSKKDNEVWGFLFDYSDEIYFKNFMDCNPRDINGREPYYWETYRGGYLAVKVMNRNIVEKKFKSLTLMGGTHTGLINLKLFHGRDKNSKF